MTLSAWIRPSESQSGWRTIMSRQTDAYFLMAGGGSHRRLGPLDDVLAALLVGATIWFCLTLCCGTARASADGDAHGGRHSRCSSRDLSSMPRSRPPARLSAQFS